ncbi:Glyoxal oxidase [Rhizoctonia solani]|uniref:Glyoxal oxidase n=1 Tax=Rhizoctonia solani TaxID=456999 RepID=A0A8H7IDZ2_9AGAM|nr:Glyoxal oxidase [Rhizoctonia solani]
MRQPRSLTHTLATSAIIYNALFNAAPTFAQEAGSIVQVGDTLVSAMMMLLGNEEKVYMMDKVEGNAQIINGHPAWGAEWDIATNKATPMDMNSNVFCASGMHFPNGSFATFGGNGAIGPGGNVGSVSEWGSGVYDETYKDYDGTKAIRILDPCTTGNCAWFDNANVLAMQRKRWYSTAEPLADGSIILIGGFVNGGYINRNTPNIDPAYEGGAAEPTYEYWPSRYSPPRVMQFMIDTSGLNSYAHAFLMPSGKIFAQANYSTSSDMPEDAWGNYSYPNINTWDYPASTDCHSIIPEPTDNSAPTYVKDDDLPDPRTMGQFILLPDGTMLVINGAANGTAGYAQATGQTALYGDMPWGMSLASAPVFKPVIYDPTKPSGKRWSDKGLSESKIPRLYHSSAILLPDASVLVAGSNPNVDVNLTTAFPTEYRAEIFYPPYFANISSRPVPHNLPTKLGYGGDSFDIELGPESYAGNANDAAKATKVVLVRPGFTTHAMNMGQRYVQLNNTFTVSDTGNITLHVSQVYPNPNLLQPGPVLMFVVVHGLPSVGKMLTVGTGKIEAQPTAAIAELPASVTSTKAPVSTPVPTATVGTASKLNNDNLILIIACAAGGAALIGLIALLVLCKKKRKDDTNNEKSNNDFAPGMAAVSRGLSISATGRRAQGEKPFVDHRSSQASSAFVPLQQYNNSAFDVHGEDIDKQGYPAGHTYLGRAEDRYSNGSNSSAPYGAGAAYATASQVPLQAYDDSHGPQTHGQYGDHQYGHNGYQSGGGASYDNYGAGANEGRRWGPAPEEEEPRVPVSPTGSVTFGFLDHYSARPGGGAHPPPGLSNLRQQQ